LRNLSEKYFINDLALLRDVIADEFPEHNRDPRNEAQALSSQIAPQALMNLPRSCLFGVIKQSGWWCGFGSVL
jgi:hypothetical protein